MNREKLEAKLRNYEERLKDVAKAIKETREQLDEKPKLRHGDFGYDSVGSCLITKRNQVLEWCGANSGAGSEVANKEDRITIFGNIFDLMEGWGEDLGGLEPGYGIIPQRSFKPIKIGGNWYEKEEAYDIWRWIGHALMKLKRKENSCS